MVFLMEENLEPNNKATNEISDNATKSNSEEIKELKSEVLDNNGNNSISQNNSAPKIDLKKENSIPADNDPKAQYNSAPKVDIKNENDTTVKNIPKPKKELPIEKKPFQEFVNVHLIPSLIEEINQRGLEINYINLQNTNRPIAGDKCWVINCEIKDTCNFWLSFEKDDISSLKSISLSKPNQTPSIIESFLIDEKRITLKLIISRVLQRLNGQKLIGVN